MVAKAVKVTPKGQITIPIDMRHDLGINGGDIVYVQRSERGIEIVTPEELVAQTAGIFKEYADKVGPVEWDRDEIWTEIARERYEQMYPDPALPGDSGKHDDHD